MAQVKTLPGEKLLVQIGNGGSPETFAHPCMINTDRGIQISSETSEIIVPDCDDPTLPAFKEILKDGMSLQVSGGGTLHTPDIEDWYEWAISDIAKNVKVVFDVTGANGGGSITVPMKLTQFNINATRKQNANVEVTLMSHGTPSAWAMNP